MKFGTVAIDEAEGAILAHSLTVPGGRIKKGTVLDADDLNRLTGAGHQSVLVARLEPGDVSESEAARRLAEQVAGKGTTRSAPFTGRVNLLAASAGVVRIDTSAVRRLNAIHESLTLATVLPDTLVATGQMLATVKVIPFSVPETILQTGIGVAEGGLISVAAFEPATVGLLITQLPGEKPGLEAKTVSVTQGRLARFGAAIGVTRTCRHETQDIAAELRTMSDEVPGPILIFSSSAVVDRGDVVPAGLVAAGGTIVHFGMPVDPGNLLLVGDLAGRPVLAAPGSARSPRLHGFDWALGRIFAGLRLDGEAIAGMGVGGLLKEIPSRPQPRTAASERRRPASKRIAAVILAAGQSRRMGAANKLLAKVRGQPMVVHAVRAASDSMAERIVVVTGHEADAVRGALAGETVTFVHNPDFADGLAGSLRTGIQALGDDVDGAVILLGDMPGVGAEHVDALIDAFSPEDGRIICVSASKGKRGNPVLWGRGFFAELASLEGDTGARNLIRDYSDQVVQVELGDAVLVDIDTPDALQAALARRSAAEDPDITGQDDD